MRQNNALKHLFQASDIPFDVEKRGGAALVRQALLVSRELIRVLGQKNLALFIRVERGNDQLWQSDSMVEAGCDPACKGVAQAGQNWQACP